MKLLYFLSGILLISVNALSAPKTSKFAIPLIGDYAPSFTAKTTNGYLTFPSDFGTSWKILFSHPRDFTPVCSSEIIELATMEDEFKKLGVKIAVISTDSLNRHFQWKKALEEISYKGRTPVIINFPLIADDDYDISMRYGMIHKKYNKRMDVRGVFIISPENKVCAIYFYPSNIGRNMEEIKRVVTALQVAGRDCSTPANWISGEDVLVPHFPYTESELNANPGLEKNYYNYGPFIWFKKSN